MASGDEQVDKEFQELLAQAEKLPPSDQQRLEQSWWTYPVARFFGHALYEYRYGIDFSECTAATNQERNSILYKSYCDLLGSLVAMCVKDGVHGTTPLEVIMSMIIYCMCNEDKTKQGILNLLRAVHGVQHFGCVIMRYCNFFKCLCLEDMKTCVTSSDLKLQAPWKQVMDSLSECICEEHHKYDEEVFDFCEQLNLPSTLSSIPFICEVGVKLNSGPNYDELMKDLQSQFTKAASDVKAIKEKSEVPMDKERTPEDQNKRLDDKDTTSDDLVKPVGDTEVKSKSESMSPSESTQHDEIRTTKKTKSPLSPSEAFQKLIEDFKSANKPIPDKLLSSLSRLEAKDPYSKFARSKSTSPKSMSPSSLSASQSPSTKGRSWPPSPLQFESRLAQLRQLQLQSTKHRSSPLSSQLQSTKGRSPPSASQLKSIKGHSSPSAAQLQSTKGHSPPSASQSKSTKGHSSPVAVIQSPTSHTASPSASLHKPKEKSLSPKLAFSSGLFSSDAAERNKIIVDLPNSDSSRESYILSEYDCRMKKHIAFQAARFELLNAQTGMHEVSNLIHQQRRFEERWPLRYSETTPSEEFYNESVFDTKFEVSELNMTEILEESQKAIKILQVYMHLMDHEYHMHADK